MEKNYLILSTCYFFVETIKEGIGHITIQVVDK